MAGSTQFQDNDWVVFLDGVQIPYLSLSYSSGVNQVTQGTVIVEPDILLQYLRPRSVIAIFCKDRYSAVTYGDRESELLNGFFYVAGGEVMGLSYSKEPHGRSMTLSFASDLQLLDDHQGFVSGIGGNPYFGTVVGTTLINPFELDVGAPKDLLPWTVLAETFNKAADSSDADFGRRILRLISWLMTLNGSLRMQAVRTRFINKIAAIDDRCLTLLAGQSVAMPMFDQLRNTVVSDDTVLTMIRKIQAKVGYLFTTVPLPYSPPSPAKPEIAQVPIHLESKVPEKFRLQRDWYRNDYLFIPNLFYSAPPPCNFIFPDMIGSMSTSRSFMAEPTRSVFLDSTFDLGAKLVFVEAPGILKEDIDRLQTPDEFWANFTHFMQTNTDVQTPADSPWRSYVSPEGKSYNLLKLVSDDELEKGIVLNYQQLNEEYMLALARNLQLKQADGSWDVQGLENVRKLVADPKKAGLTTEDLKAKAYFVYVQEWLRYQHQLRRWNRPSQIVLKGHRWLVPGFSAVIFDSDGCYLTYVVSVSYDVSPGGAEHTTVQIDRTRPLSTINTALSKQVEATVNDAAQAVIKSQEVAEEVLNSDTAYFDRLLRELLGDRRKIVAAQLEYDAAVGRNDVRATIVLKLQPTIKRFEQNYATIVGRASENANVVVGPSKNEAGALSASLNSGLDVALLDFLDPTSIDKPGDFEAVSAAYAHAARAVELIRTFNTSQINQLRSNLPTHGPTEKAVQALNAANIDLAIRGDELSALIAKLDTVIDFPTPPSYYNPDFIDLATLDKQYQDLLGCRPFYTGPYSEGLSGTRMSSVASKLRDLAGNSGVLSNPLNYMATVVDRVDSFNEHLRMLKIMSRVYPAVIRSPNIQLTEPIVVDNTKLAATATSWDDISNSDDNSESTMQWQHEQFLKRKAQTLIEYLRTHGFESSLEALISDEPAPFVFYRMVPRPTPSGNENAVPGVNRKVYPWDDSVLCRIVDENTRITDFAPAGAPDMEAVTEELAKVNVSPYSGEYYLSPNFDGTFTLTVPPGIEAIIPALEKDRVTPREPDRLVAERRAQAASRGAVQLTSGFRQDQVTAYSRKHMGSRAFDGE